MPVFRAGESQARAAAALLRVPFYPVSHQEGHVRAAMVDSNIDAKQPFLALHLSGGTTEILLCDHGELTLLGGSLDLHAGQLVDRTGVRMKLGFPAGPALEKLAMAGMSAGAVRSLIGVSVKLLLEAFLLGLPSVGILGAPISTLLCNMTVLLLNILALRRAVFYPLFAPSAFLRPLVAAFLAVLLGGVFYGAVGLYCGYAIWQVPLLIVIVGAFYALFALRFGAVLPEDLKELPCGAVLCRALAGCKLLRKEKTHDKG